MRFYVYPELRYFRSIKQLKKFIQQTSLCRDVELIIAAEVNGKVVKMCITRDPRIALHFCDEVVTLSYKRLFPFKNQKILKNILVLEEAKEK